MNIDATLSSAAITAIMQVQPKIGLFMSFLPVIQKVQERIIELDFKKNGTNIASFVNPNAKAKGKKLDGFEVRQFTLPTKKGKYIITSDDLSKKLFGTTIYNKTASLQTKALDLMDTAITDLKDDDFTRDEVSAAEQVFKGTLSIVGEGENRSLDFQRSATNEFDLGTGNYWGEAGADPKGDFDKFITTAGQSGHVLTHAIAQPEVMQVLTNNDDIKDELDNRRIENGSLAFESYAASIGAIYYGIYKNIALWGYTGIYTDEDGVSQTAVPEKQIAFMSRVSKNGTIEGYARDVAVEFGKDGVAIDSDMFITKVEVSDEPSEATIHGIKTSTPLLLDPDSTIVATVLA